MPQRLNWQINRKMEYPYAAPPPKKQVAYIFDTNKCIECQTCTLACKTCWTSGKGQEHIFWNNVETRPYGGYPTGWDLKLLEKKGPAFWENGLLKSQTIFEDHGPLDPPTGHLPDECDYAFPNLAPDRMCTIFHPCMFRICFSIKSSAPELKHPKPSIGILKKTPIFWVHYSYPDPPIKSLTGLKSGGDKVLAWNGKGEKIFDVPFTEPVYIRKHFDEHNQVYRHNTT